MRQRKQNAQYYTLTIKILQLPHVTTLFGSSSGNAHQFYVQNIFCVKEIAKYV